MCGWQGVLILENLHALGVPEVRLMTRGGEGARLAVWDGEECGRLLPSWDSLAETHASGLSAATAANQFAVSMRRAAHQAARQDNSGWAGEAVDKRWT